MSGYDIYETQLIRKVAQPNIHMYYLRSMERVANESLPTRVNLDRRGIDLHLVRCPVCDDDLETENHIFVHCVIAKQMWAEILKWWNLHNLIPSNLF